MADQLTQALSALSISASSVSHPAASAEAPWSSNLPQDVKATKTLVFKPKGAKNAPVKPVILVALDSTDVGSANVIAKEVGIKEMRAAGEEVWTEWLGADKDSASPLVLSAAKNGPEGSHPALVIIDSALSKAAPETKVAFHAQSNSSSLVLTVSEFNKFVESQKLEAQHIDFVELKTKQPAPSAKQPPASKPAVAPAASSSKQSAKIEDAELIGITVRKAGDFPEWYQQVLRKGDMLDYYDVSGCYILKPWSYTVWEAIQKFFDGEIKKLGVQNCYFPMFVSSDVLEREKDHIEGFAPEVAWVTRAGKSELDKPVAIRPTSETVMYPYYAKWIQSHRDLPLKLNQWNSVVRWEFKHPQPFLRTREFLWQEGHTAHVSLDEAGKEVRQILDLYAKVYTDLLALPVVPGVKSEKEKFAGGLYTTTVEGFVPTTGRGIQGGTSHCLGQNFSKMFNIAVEDPNAPKEKQGTPEGRLFVWQNSWGLSTRTIGVMVMVHGDDKGLVMPPRVSQVQVVVIPCGITAKTTPEERKSIEDACANAEKELLAGGVRAKADLRDLYSPGWKFNDWEMRGVPVRMEIGPKDLKNDSRLLVRRDNGVKASTPAKDIVPHITTLLDTIHHDMYKRADDEYRSHRKTVTEWSNFTKELNGKNHVVIPWCEVEECEDAIKERSARSAEEGEEQDEKAPSMGAKSLCIPFDQEQFGDIKGLKCPQCGTDAKRWTMFGRSY
ncbi:unnamed protein product [Sympodiomycopsis kandeliae]